MAAAAQRNLSILVPTVLLLFSIPPSSLAANTLTQGGPVVNSSASLVSPNGLFTLGFRRSAVGSYLGIWYINATSGFFWVANRDVPIRDGSGSLSLDQNGTLKLTYSGGGAIVNLYSDSRRRRLIATLDDTGNFVVSDVDSGDLLWQSFDSPTNAWFPGMKLGLVGGENRKLTSWLTESIPAAGAFTLEWDPTAGNEELVMKHRGVTFWTSGKQWTPNRFANLDLRLQRVNYNVSRVVAGPNSDYLTFRASTNEYSSANQLSFTVVRLRYDGVVEDVSTRIVILQSEDCHGNGTENGCRRWDGPDCRRSGDGFQLLWGTFSLGQWVDEDSNMSISDCKEQCWRNCECGGISLDGVNRNGTGCRYFRSGGFIQLPNQEGEDRYHVIIAGERQADTSNASRIKWIAVSVTAAVAILILALCIFWFLRRRKFRERLLAELMATNAPSDGDDMGDDGDPSHHLKIYSAASIMIATDSFSMQNKLGEGGFGPVYKGTLSEGREVAVKRLSKRSDQGLIEFRNELVLIAKLQHRNLVKLLGCCIHGEEKMLVYEYMPNKSLDSFIFDETKRVQLDWNKRFNIIEGIAQGLLYLHKYSRVTIIHRDLKVSNILLDENLNPKISDFGMARIFKTNTLEANTAKPVGTYGYMSPEYAIKGTFSTKSDVFSFGVMLLEIVSGKKNYNLIPLDPPIDLVEYAWKLWKEGSPLEFMDPTMEGSDNYKDQILRCINVGLLCIEYNTYDRPEMSEVISMLTSNVVQLPMPEQPGFIMTRPRNHEGSSSTSASKFCSSNEVTITMMVAR
ncbi:unnamed protein product [Linum trigynum]|uniref:Receptor-like serine/threonine-protein kinase n=1 Tax=Linum trigynum TaxID=586398 RepID=A0AAV2CP18_9ROSI